MFVSNMLVPDCVTQAPEGSHPVKAVDRQVGILQLPEAPPPAVPPVARPPVPIRPVARPPAAPPAPVAPPLAAPPAPLSLPLLLLPPQATASPATPNTTIIPSLRISVSF